jgi:putative peptide zinc metalloprotease protein
MMKQNEAALRGNRLINGGQTSPPDGASMIPLRRGIFEEARFLSASGEPYWIIHQKPGTVYIRLDEGDYFLWSLMDGKHNEIDIVLAYFQKFGTFPLERLDILVQRLSRRRFLLPAGCKDSPQSAPPRWFEKMAQSFWQIEISITAADGIFSHLYRRTGWIFTSRPSLVIMGAICIIGTAFFIMEEPNQSYPLFFEGSSFFAGIIWVYLALIVSAALHECGHAFACKAHGRTINAAGIVIYFGFPCLYVDTSDIWMADRKARIAVSLAGPAANVVFGSLFSLAVLLAPDLFLANIFWRIAFLSFLLAFVNLNPLLELDGYYVLEDLFEIPNLRGKSFSFIRSAHWTKRVLARERLDRAERIYTLYGAGAGAYTIATGLFIVYLWEAHISDLVAKSLNGTLMRGELLYSLVVVLILTPFILGLALRSLGIIRQIIESAMHLSKR